MKKSLLKRLKRGALYLLMNNQLLKQMTKFYLDKTKPS